MPNEDKNAREINALIREKPQFGYYYGSITFLWDGVKGLQTRKSNATAGLSDIYG